MAQKKAAQKKETVNKIRAIADLIKAHSESDDELVTESNALEIQEFVAGIKEMMKSFDPSIFFTMNALSKINTAKTKQEATRRLERAMSMRDNYGDVKDTAVNILDIIGGVANKPELLDEILKEFLKSVSVIINKFGNVVEKSESVDVDIFEVLMRKIATSPWLKDEDAKEDETLFISIDLDADVKGELEKLAQTLGSYLGACKFKFKKTFEYASHNEFATLFLLSYRQGTIIEDEINYYVAQLRELNPGIKIETEYTTSEYESRDESESEKLN